MILIPEYFNKLLKKIKSIGIKEVVLEIEKHKKGLDNFIKIREKEGTIVFKGYLLSNKVRLLVYFQKFEGEYMPFYVVKKETEKGYNIRKESFNNLENDLKRSLKDIKLGKFLKVEN